MTIINAWDRIARVLALLALLWSPSSAGAQTSSVTIAWDAPADPTVAGYVVYVGTESGTYREQFDIGNSTLFDYFSAESGRRYFFAVRSYNAARTLSDRSNEVSVTIGERGAGGAQGQSDTAQRTASPSRQRWPDPAHSGSEAATTAAGPSSAIPRSRSARVVADAGAAGILMIDAGRAVRTVVNGAIAPEPLLTVSDSVELSGLTIDPRFARTRHVFVSEVQTRPDGDRELTIARYRVGAQAFGERAAIVIGLTLPPVGTPVFNVDGAGRLYLAVPRGPGAQRPADPYQGMILRFNVDGTVPRDSRAASPILAYGYAQPTALEFDDAGRLWLAGADAPWSHPLAFLTLGGGSADWPAMPQGVPVPSSPNFTGISDLELVRARTVGESAKLALIAGDWLSVMPLGPGAAGDWASWSLGRHGAPTALLHAGQASVYVSFDPTGDQDGSVERGAPLLRFQIP